MHIQFFRMSFWMPQSTRCLHICPLYIFAKQFSHRWYLYGSKYWWNQPLAAWFRAKSTTLFFFVCFVNLLLAIYAWQFSWKGGVTRGYSPWWEYFKVEGCLLELHLRYPPGNRRFSRLSANFESQWFSQLPVFVGYGFSRRVYVHYYAYWNAVNLREVIDYSSLPGCLVKPARNLRWIPGTWSRTSDEHNSYSHGRYRWGPPSRNLKHPADVGGTFP